ncbi:MAG: hypothetical protein M0P17_05435 [Methanoculleus sp.]|nr:hypothetical protein [Methanoculleus sp.]
MNILFIITDSSGYKTYLELKNYLHNNNCHINLNYYYINADINDIKFDSNKFYHENSRLIDSFEGEDEVLSKYYDEYYNINRPYGYALARTMFIPSTLIVLKNYLNNEQYLLSNLNTKEYLTTIKYKHYKDYIEFEEQYNNIPDADLYLISERNGSCNTSLLTIQLSLALYLHRKYKDSKIIIGGGRNNTKNNSIVNLINAIGKNYTDNKLEFCVGDIGPVIYNYINNTNYNNVYGMNKKEVLDLDISEYEMKYILKNNFGVSYSKGCINNCPFCIGHNISTFDIINNINIYNKYFIYLNKNYPNTNINVFDNEINHTKDYFATFMHNIISLNINNPITIFLDMKMITDNDIMLMKQYKNIILNVSADYLDTINKKDIITNFKHMYDKLKNNNINVDKIYMVANIPNFKTINNIDFLEVFKYSYNNNIYEDFRLELSSDLYINADKYGISFFNYNNIDETFKDINEELNNIPIMYYRSDYNRKELLNEKYKLLNKLKGYLLLIVNNKLKSNNLIDSLVVNSFIYRDLIDNRIKYLDDLVDEYVKR